MDRVEAPVTYRFLWWFILFLLSCGTVRADEIDEKKKTLCNGLDYPSKMKCETCVSTYAPEYKRCQNLCGTIPVQYSPEGDAQCRSECTVRYYKNIQACYLR
jgi:hypothetical protein